MQKQGLLATEGQGFRLTREGERLALQVVARIDCSSDTSPTKRGCRCATCTPWPSERNIHCLPRTPTGCPRRSAIPHTILTAIRFRHARAPSSTATGTPATSWPADTIGRIVHLEDEPEISFAQILADRTPHGPARADRAVHTDCVVLSDGRARVPAGTGRLPRMCSSPPLRCARGRIRWCGSRICTDNAPAEVVGLDEACQGFSRRRLMDLGFTDGARIRPFLKTFAGDPRAYEVRGTLIACGAIRPRTFWCGRSPDQPAAEPGS
jgi:DtxR family Mn-dependent transcriptional regulator